MQAVIKEEVEAMLEADNIESTKAAYNSPVVIVRKKDGSNHFCIDFRRLNLITKFDAEPMGNPEAIIAKLERDRYKMPFGLLNSAATFNRMMRKMLHNLRNIDHYMNDVLTHTVRWEDHVKTLQQLF